MLDAQRLLPPEAVARRRQMRDADVAEARRKFDASTNRTAAAGRTAGRRATGRTPAQRAAALLAGLSPKEQAEVLATLARRPGGER